MKATFLARAPILWPGTAANHRPENKSRMKQAMRTQRNWIAGTVLLATVLLGACVKETPPAKRNSPAPLANAPAHPGKENAEPAGDKQRTEIALRVEGMT